MTYTYSKELEGDFEEIEARVREELKKRGFGVLTEIDVKKTLKEKLNVDHPEYKILGACNPPFSHKVLEREKEVGALLPCNVLIYKDGDKIKVSTILPTSQMNIIGDEEIENIAKEVESLLKEVVDSV